MAVKMSEVVAAVREIAAERPDVKYDVVEGAGCLYSAGRCSDGSVGCIVGQALVKCGFDVAPLDTSDDENDGGIKTAGFACRHIGVETDDFEAANWLDNAQHWQDSGHPWGDAVKFADGELELDEDDDSWEDEL